MSSALIPTFTIADRLVRAREMHGWSQTDLADALGLSRQTVRRREAEERPPRAYVLAVSAVTGVPAWWITGDDEDTEAADVTLRERITPGQQAFDLAA